jgi:invasion protein IalB
MRCVLQLAAWCGAALILTSGIAAAQNDRTAPARPVPRPSHARPPAPQHAVPQAQAQPIAPGAGSGGQAAAPVPARPPVPLRTEIWNFDSWTTTCSEFEDKKKVCSARLQVTQSGNRNILLAWIITLNAENRPINVLQTPTGVSIAPGVELKLGKAAARKVPFTTCDNGHCTATLAMDRDLVRDMTMTAEAEIVIYAPNGSGVQFKFPLKGFEKAYAQLSK